MQSSRAANNCTDSISSIDLSAGRFCSSSAKKTTEANISKADSKSKRSDVAMEDGEQSLCSVESSECLSAKKRDNRGVSQVNIKLFVQDRC